MFLALLDFWAWGFTITLGLFAVCGAFYYCLKTGYAVYDSSAFQRCRALLSKT